MCIAFGPHLEHQPSNFSHKQTMYNQIYLREVSREPYF